MLDIRLIDEAHQADINLKNEPFEMDGRMVVERTCHRWTYHIEPLESGHEVQMCFPDENYSFEAMRSNHVFIGAYEGDCIVGLAIMRQAMFAYMYLYDLKVNRAYRRNGVARMLLEKAMEVSRENGYRGIYTQAQDDNLCACRFYLASGFRIGGLNTDVYHGTLQADKADIYFFRDRLVKQKNRN